MLKLRYHESHLGRRFDILSVCSELDRASLNDRSPTYVIPNGFSRPTVTPVRNPSHPPRIGFMGLYSYEPNMDGARCFVQNCWEKIKAAVPGVRLPLIGKDSDCPLKPNDPSVDGIGWMEN